MSLLSSRWTPERGHRYYIDRNCVSSADWLRYEHLHHTSGQAAEHHALNFLDACPLCVEGRVAEHVTTGGPDA